MADDTHLAGLDPFDLLDAEIDRVDRHVATLRGADWERPSRCAGWSTRDVLAHMTSSEEYNRASLNGTVAAFLADLGARGATDLATANELGVRDHDGSAPEQIVAVWRERARRNAADLRARDEGDVDTTVGPYPARWQTFHLAFEVATHADDIGVPVEPGEATARLDWLTRFGRFVVTELHPDATVEAGPGTTRVRGDGVDVELADDEFVHAVQARLPGDHPLDAGARAFLSATP